VSWSLEQAYETYPEIEAEFSAVLDESLNPRSLGLLVDLVAELRLAPGSVALDVGSGEGEYAVELHERFGFRVTGIDPVPRNIAAARSAAAARGPAGDGGPVFELGRAEDIPAADGSVDLVWCRDVLVHVADLARAYSEFRRVLRPGGHAVVYQMFATELLEPLEAAWLFGALGVVPESTDPARTDEAIAASGLQVDQRLVIGTEFGEWSQEHRGHPGRKLLHAARLRREPSRYIERFGQSAYEIMLGDSLWHVYALLGKLSRRIYVLSAPAS
jgi:SAM-dependent methyltransferase